MAGFRIRGEGNSTISASIRLVFKLSAFLINEDLIKTIHQSFNLPTPTFFEISNQSSPNKISLEQEKAP